MMLVLGLRMGSIMGVRQGLKQLRVKTFGFFGCVHAKGLRNKYSRIVSKDTCPSQPS